MRGITLAALALRVMGHFWEGKGPFPCMRLRFRMAIAAFEKRDMDGVRERILASACFSVWSFPKRWPLF